MAEIVKFPQKPSADESTKSEQDRRIAEHNDEEKKQRLRHLNDNLASRPRMHKRSDRETVAGNLWQLLEELEQQGIKKVRIVQRWRPGQATDSTKRLDTYTLPQDLTEDERNARINRLTQKAAGYVELVDKI